MSIRSTYASHERAALSPPWIPWVVGGITALGFVFLIGMFTAIFMGRRTAKAETIETLAPVAHHQPKTNTPAVISLTTSKSILDIYGVKIDQIKDLDDFKKASRKIFQGLNSIRAQGAQAEDRYIAECRKVEQALSPFQGKTISGKLECSYAYTLVDPVIAFSNTNHFAREGYQITFMMLYKTSQSGHNYVGRVHQNHFDPQTWTLLEKKRELKGKDTPTLTGVIDSIELCPDITNPEFRLMGVGNEELPVPYPRICLKLSGIHIK